MALGPVRTFLRVWVVMKISDQTRGFATISEYQTLETPDTRTGSFGKGYVERERKNITKSGGRLFIQDIAAVVHPVGGSEKVGSRKVALGRRHVTCNHILTDGTGETRTVTLNCKQSCLRRSGLGCFQSIIFVISALPSQLELGTRTQCGRL